MLYTEKSHPVQLLYSLFFTEFVNNFLNNTCDLFLKINEYRLEPIFLFGFAHILSVVKKKQVGPSNAKSVSKR